MFRFVEDFDKAPAARYIALLLLLSISINMINVSIPVEVFHVTFVAFYQRKSLLIHKTRTT